MSELTTRRRFFEYSSELDMVRHSALEDVDRSRQGGRFCGAMNQAPEDDSHSVEACSRKETLDQAHVLHEEHLSIQAYHLRLREEADSSLNSNQLTEFDELRRRSRLWCAMAEREDEDLLRIKSALANNVSPFNSETPVMFWNDWSRHRPLAQHYNSIGDDVTEDSFGLHSAEHSEFAYKEENDREPVNGRLEIMGSFSDFRSVANELSEATLHCSATSSTGSASTASVTSEEETQESNLQHDSFTETHNQSSHFDCDIFNTMGESAMYVAQLQEVQCRVEDRLQQNVIEISRLRNALFDAQNLIAAQAKQIKSMQQAHSWTGYTLGSTAGSPVPPPPVATESSMHNWTMRSSSAPPPSSLSSPHHTYGFPLRPSPESSLTPTDIYSHPNTVYTTPNTTNHPLLHTPSTMHQYSSPPTNPILSNPLFCSRTTRTGTLSYTTSPTSHLTSQHPPSNTPSHTSSAAPPPLDLHPALQATFHSLHHSMLAILDLQKRIHESAQFAPPLPVMERSLSLPILSTLQTLPHHHHTICPGASTTTPPPPQSAQPHAQCKSFLSSITLILHGLALLTLQSLLSSTSSVYSTTVSTARSIFLLLLHLPTTLHPVLLQLNAFLAAAMHTPRPPKPLEQDTSSCSSSAAIATPPPQPLHGPSPPDTCPLTDPIQPTAAEVVAPVDILPAPVSHNATELPQTVVKGSFEEACIGGTRPLHREPSVWDWATKHQQRPCMVRQQPVASSALVELGAASVCSSELSSDDSEGEEDMSPMPLQHDDPDPSSLNSSTPCSCIQTMAEGSVDLGTQKISPIGSTQESADSPVPFANAPTTTPCTDQASIGDVKGVCGATATEKVVDEDEVMMALVAAGMMSPYPPLPKPEASLPDTLPLRRTTYAMSPPRVPGGRLQGLLSGACRAVRGLAAVARASVAGGEAAVGAAEILLSPVGARQACSSQRTFDILSPPPLPQSSPESAASPASKISDWDDFCSSIVAGGEPVLPLPPMLNVPRLQHFTRESRKPVKSFALQHGLTPRSLTPRLRLASPRSFFLTEAELRSARTPRVARSVPDTPPKAPCPSPAQLEVREDSRPSTGFRFGAGVVRGGLRVMRRKRSSHGSRSSSCPMPAVDKPGASVKRSFQQYVEGSQPCKSVHARHARRSVWCRDSQQLGLQGAAERSKGYKAHCTTVSANLCIY